MSSVTPEEDDDMLTPVYVPRTEIDRAKRILKSNRAVYGQMLRLIANPAAVFRVRMVPGTLTLQLAVNVLAVLARLLPFIAIGLLIFVGWKSAVLVAACWFVLVNPVQTELNYEIAARLLALDQRLEPES